MIRVLDLASVLTASIIVFCMFKFTRQNRQKTRQAIVENFRMRLALSTDQRLLEFYQRLFKSLGKYSKRSLILAAVDDFKASFNLGRFVIFEWDHGAFAPIMSAGLNLRSVRHIRIDAPESDSHGSSGHSRLRLLSSDGLPTDQDGRLSLARQANLPADLTQLFLYHHKDDQCHMLFLGEDTGGELARLCLADEFNKSAWPVIYDVYIHGNSLKKDHDKLKDLEYQLDKSKANIVNIPHRPKQSVIDTQSILGISNQLFMVYNEERLYEILVESISSILSASCVVVFTRTDNNILKARMEKGQTKPSIQGLELSSDSEILSSIMNPRPNRVIPIPIPEIRPDNFLDGIIFDNRLVLACRLYLKDNLDAVILIGERKDGQVYSEADFELLSSVVNISCLALGNIQQYNLIEKMSYTDSMTELYNYRYFYKRLNEEIYRAKRFNRTLALVIFDIDNFKTFNDSLGHQAGDEVLKILATLVLSSVRAIDIVSRYGGEEFCIIMPDTGFANCLIFIERLRKMIADHKFAVGKFSNCCEITVSSGGAIYPNDAQTADRLIYCADMALLQAKSGGRNRVIMYHPQMADEIEKNSVLNENNDNLEINDET